MSFQGFLEVWGEGTTFEELCTAIRAFPEHRKQRWSQPHLSFKIVVDGWGRSISQQEQLELIDQLAFLNMAVRKCEPQASRLGSDCSGDPGASLRKLDVCSGLIGPSECQALSAGPPGHRYTSLPMCFTVRTILTD